SLERSRRVKPLVFDEQVGEADLLAQALCMYEGSHSFSQRHRRLAGQYLLVSPHRVRAASKNVEIQGLLRLGQIVSSEQRRVAVRAKILQHGVSQYPAACRPRALKVTESG